MKRIAQLAIGALAIAVVAPSAAAQETQQEGFFGKPAFVLQPGAVILNAISGVGDEPKGDTDVLFNARFATVVPTKFPYFQLVAGAQYQPNPPRAANGVRNTAPAIFYGGIIPLAFLTELSGGFFSASIDPLGVFAQGLGGTSDSFGHDFVLEGALVANVGQKMFTNMGFFSSTSLFLLVDQVITHAPRDPDTGDRDFWNPVLVTGITIPVGR